MVVSYIHAVEVLLEVVSGVSVTMTYLQANPQISSRIRFNGFLPETR